MSALAVLVLGGCALLVAIGVGGIHYGIRRSWITYHYDSLTFDLQHYPDLARKHHCTGCAYVGYVPVDGDVEVTR